MSPADVKVTRPTAERATPTHLGAMLYLWRTVNRHSLRDLGKEIGVSAATLMRVEHGYGTDAATFVKLLAWMTKP